MILRLGADVETFLDLPDATPFIVMAGRRMKQWIVVPPAMLKSQRALKTWLGRIQVGHVRLGVAHRAV